MEWAFSSSFSYSCTVEGDVELHFIYVYNKDKYDSEAAYKYQQIVGTNVQY